MDEGSCREILSGERATVLVQIVESAWAAHVDEKRARSRRTRANVVWDYMTQFAERELIGMPGVRCYEQHGIPMYVFDEQLVARFKMHDLGLVTQNIPTGHQQQLALQGHLEGLPALEVISLGYVLDRAEADIRKVVAVRRVRRKLDWWIDLRELASGVCEPTTPIFPVDASPAKRPLPGIAPIRRERDGTADE